MQDVRSSLSFMGYQRADGRVGTRNYWLVISLVPDHAPSVASFREGLLTTLGYQGPNPYLLSFRALREQYRAGSYFGAPLPPPASALPRPLFAHIDGVKFLTVSAVPGESPGPDISFLSTLMGYCQHPNVGGITVLSEGAAGGALREHIDALETAIAKPLLVADRLSYTREADWLTEAGHDTFRAMTALNRQPRQPAPLASLMVGIRWGAAGGSLANAAVGQYVQLVLGLGATVLMASPASRPETNEKRLNPCPHAPTMPVTGLRQVHLPGDPVAATTALIASGCTLHLSTNGSLPTGNPVAPVVELAASQLLTDDIPDWVDLDCGDSCHGSTPVQRGEAILHYCLKLASGQQQTRAEVREQEAFRRYQP